jgi:activator of HSP90 ATPase
LKEYKKYFSIPAPPDEVYAALTNSISMQLMTGEKAEMSDQAGSEFSLWDGSIVGKNIEFEENKKIVQQWYFGDDTTESIVTIKLHADKNSTSLELKHSHIPDTDFNEIVDGWNNVYMSALIEFFDE